MHLWVISSGFLGVEFLDESMEYANEVEDEVNRYGDRIAKVMTSLSPYSDGSVASDPVLVMGKNY
jgi:hypothetical protein